MILRLASIFLLLIMLSLSLGACSTVPDRYAPWRDNDAPNMTGGRKPNLGDVPAAPNVDDAKKQIDAMRTRMEQDRQNAYLASQGIINQDSGLTAPQASVAPMNAAPVVDSNLPPVGNVNAAPPPATAPVPMASTTALPEPALTPVVQNQTAQNATGNVYYNYDPSVGNEYNYGFRPMAGNDSVQVNMPGSVMADNNPSSDPSVAIDLSVLGGSPSNSPAALANRPMLASGGITTGEPIAYFAHGSAKLGAKERSKIVQLAKVLKQNPHPVVLAGNASSRTGISNTELSREVNLKISEKRASTVMHELVKQGVNPEQIYISANGDAMPNRRKGDGMDEAANRRVEILFDK